MSEHMRKAGRTIWSYARHYAYGAFSKGWNGAWAAVYGFIGSSVGSAIDPQSIQAPNLRLLIYCFASAWAIGVAGYFKDHPLPDRLPDTTAPFPR
jgi:hypothetical protein